MQSHPEAPGTRDSLLYVWTVLCHGRMTFRGLFSSVPVWVGVEGVSRVRVPPATLPHTFPCLPSGGQTRPLRRLCT